MGSLILMALAFSVFVYFLYSMLFTTENKNRAYLKFIFIAFPFIGIDLLPSFLSTTLFVFITVIFIFFFYVRTQPQFTGSFSYSILFYLLLIIVGTGLYLSDDLSQDSITDVVQLIAVFLFAKILVDELRQDPAFRDTLLLCMGATLIFSFLFLACQFVFGPDFSFAKYQNINVAGGISIRYPSFFQDPQKYAQYLAASSLLMLLLPAKSKSSLSSVGLLLCVISMFALLFTGGRAALGGWLIGLLIVIALGNAQYRAAIVSVSLVVSFFVYNYSEAIPIFKRDGLAESYAFRYAIWQDAYGIFLQHPYFGIGIGNYANYVALHNPDQYWIHDNDITFYDHPESGYLKLLTELGFIGFFVVILLFIVPMYNAISTYLKTKDLGLMIMVAAVCTWMVGFYTVYSFGDIRIKILIVSIVCMLISASNDKRLSNKTLSIG